MDWDQYSLVALGVTICISLLSLFYSVWFHHRKTPSAPSTNPPVVSKRTVEASSQRGGSTSDVWEERRRRGIQAASLHVKRDVTKATQQPFGSSYYYAHNSTKAAGGYKDGLTMEDFTMNGPRLLSRNGKPVDDDIPLEHTQPSSAARSIPDSTSSIPKTPMPPPRKVILITRYLWDDPGQGIATIRIDVLPSLPSDPTTLPWSEIRSSLTHISATLLPHRPGKAPGLLVELEARPGPDVVVYTLRLPELYGPVARVEARSKAARLLIPLTKTRAWMDKSNLRPWPHPQKAM